MIYIDGHCDTLTCAFDDKKHIDDVKYSFNSIDANNLYFEGKKVPVIQLMAAFIHPKFENGYKRAENVLNYYLENKKNTVLILNKKNLENVIDNNLVGTILTIENGKAIENDLTNIDRLYEKGIRVMSINWNEDNLLATGALTEEKTGLTKMGMNYVRKLEEKRILIDISHSSEKTFWDVIKNTKNTIVASHSCCYAICQHPRNLKDEQIIEIARRKRNYRNLSM